MGEEDDDPDWLRAFQAPSREPVMLSSGSDSSPSNTPTRTGPSRGGGKRGKKTTTRRKSLTSQKEDALGKQEEGPSVEEKQDKSSGRLTPKKGLVTLSSDSDASPGNSPPRAGQANQEDNVKEESSIRNGSRRDGPQAKGKKPKSTHAKTGTDQTDDASEHQEEGLAEEDMQYKLPGNSVSQRLPLIFPDKVQRSKALIECDGDSMDMSGDIGAVGRIVISNGPTGNQELLLDLKGTIYKSTIVPSRTFCVVSVGQTEAKIETIMNDFIQLEPQSNLFEAETMMEGTLDGFTFDSDEEGDKIPDLSAHQNDQNNEEEDQPKGKKKRKAAKPAGKGQKKAKVTVKTAKKGARKTRATKATKKTKKTKK